MSSAFWKVGPFHLTPQLRLGAGFDSNAFSSPQSPQQDVTFIAAPGLRVVTPFGRRALFEIREELDFVYFREATELRDVFHVTRIGGAFGGKNLLIRLSNEFREEQARPTTEFDIPVPVRNNNFEATISVGLGRRHELSVTYTNTRLRIDEASRAGNQLNRDEDGMRFRLSRYFTPRTTLVIEGFGQDLQFTQDQPQGQPQVYGIRGGFSFSPKGNARGQALVGFKSVTPNPSQPGFRGLSAALDAQFRLGRRWEVGALFTRDNVPSILKDNWYFVENRIGGSLGVFVARPLSLRASASVGRNAYPLPETYLDEQGQIVTRPIQDRFESYALTISYRLGPSLEASVTGNYLIRNSDLSNFEKNRFYLNAGVSRTF